MVASHQPHGLGTIDLRFSGLTGTIRPVQVHSGVRMGGNAIRAKPNRIIGGSSLRTSGHGPWLCEQWNVLLIDHYPAQFGQGGRGGAEAPTLPTNAAGCWAQGPDPTPDILSIQRRQYKNSIRERPILWEDPLTIYMATTPTTSLPHKTLQTEWEAMLARLKEVAHVLDYAAHVDAKQTGYIILDPIGTDLEKAEEIILSNLLFEPRSRIEDGDTIEIAGDWLWSWRRYTPWTLVDQPVPSWAVRARPDVRMLNYQLAVNVKVEL